MSQSSFVDRNVGELHKTKIYITSNNSLTKYIKKKIISLVDLQLRRKGTYVDCELKVESLLHVGQCYNLSQEMEVVFPPMNRDEVVAPVASLVLIIALLRR